MGYSQPCEWHSSAGLCGGGDTVEMARMEWISYPDEPGLVAMLQAMWVCPDHIGGASAQGWSSVSLSDIPA
jgi:hypothetical protein